MTPGGFLTNHDRTTIVAMARAGQIHRDISVRVGCHRDTVRQVLGALAADLAKARADRRAERRVRMRSLAEAGRSVTVIACEFGVSREVVRLACADIFWARKKARRDQMVAAVADPGRGDLSALAARFGLASAGSLSARVSQIRAAGRHFDGRARDTLSPEARHAPR